MARGLLASYGAASGVGTLLALQDEFAHGFGRTTFQPVYLAVALAFVATYYVAVVAPCAVALRRAGLGAHLAGFALLGAGALPAFTALVTLTLDPPGDLAGKLRRIAGAATELPWVTAGAVASGLAGGVAYWAVAGGSRFTRASPRHAPEYQGAGAGQPGRSGPAQRE